MGEDAEARRQAVLSVAAHLLVSKGYAAASMLQIAKAARASNETLYRWWPNKQALFRDLVAHNAEQVVTAVREAGEVELSPDVLLPIAHVLLRMLTGSLAIALNRAAAADQFDTGTLGPTLALSGRTRVKGELSIFMQRLFAAGLLHIEDPQEAADLFVLLVVGDVQIRLVTGASSPLSEAELQQRVNVAVNRFFALAGPRAT